MSFFQFRAVLPRLLQCGILASMLASPSLRAALDVSGQQNGAITWGIANSPYTVVADVQVPAGSTLTIEPGVEVKFAGGYQIYVQGAVVANGTSGAPIKFRSSTPGVSTGATMLKFEGANLSNSQVSYVEFADANRAIQVGGGGGEFNPGVACTGTLTVAKVKVSNAEVRTAGYQTNAKLVLESATLTNATVKGQYPRSEPIEINNSVVSGSVINSDSYNAGITLTSTTVTSSQLLIGCCGANLALTDCTVTSSSVVDTNSADKLTLTDTALVNTTVSLPNARAVISGGSITWSSGITPVLKFARGSVTNTTITGAGSGVGLEFGSGNGDIAITGTTITDFAVGLKLTGVRSSGTITVQTSTLQRNGSYNIENSTGSSISAPNNYWGATESSAIATTIYDRNDSITVGVVVASTPLTGPAAPPQITSQPAAAAVTVGEVARFEVVAKSVGRPTYQWRKGGQPVVGNTSAQTSTLELNVTSTALAGAYDCVVTDELGTVNSATAALIVRVPDYSGTYFGTFESGGDWAMTINSERSATYLAHLASKGTAVILKFIVAEDGTFLATGAEIGADGTLRANRGAKLLASSAPFGISGWIEGGAVHGAVVGTEEEIQGGVEAASAGESGTVYSATALNGAQGSSHVLISAGGQALIVTAGPNGVDSAKFGLAESGPSTVQTAGGGTIVLQLGEGGTSLALDFTPVGTMTPIQFGGMAAGAASTSRLSAISTRARAGSGDQTLIVGFAIAGGEKPVVLRGVGPGLVPVGVSTALLDPNLTLFAGGASGFTAVKTVDDWDGSEALSTTFSRLGLMPLSTGSQDAAMLETLNAGVYTANVSSGQANGVALVEAYDADAESSGRLVALSTRTTAGTGDDTLIVGFVLDGEGPRQVLVRGVGPSLVAQGVSGDSVLHDPKLTLYKMAGENWQALASNDNWGGSSDTEAAFAAVGVAPLESGDSADAVLLLTLSPGLYTAHVTGAAAESGVVLVELYVVP